MALLEELNIKKNPIFLIKIFEEFYKMNHGSRLVLVGTGVMEDECKALVRKNSLEDKVLFLGMQKETADYYSMFDAFLFPSLFEGLGVVLVEAQASGVPCLVSSGIPDEVMITPLIEKHTLSDTPQHWAQHLMKIVNEKIKDRKQDNYSNQITLAGYDIKEEAKRLENIYMTLIEGC